MISAPTVTRVEADAMWETEKGLQQIKQLFAPKLSSMEFTMFVEMGKATGLNPFLREIWAVKYDERNPAQIFIGRDGYRKMAQRHPMYDYHTADAVYSNDEFSVADGDVIHKYNLKDRGHLIGGYCVVRRKGSSRPAYVFVELKEYSTGKSLWGDKGKPATMIKKVAEAQALKMAFQELFSGMYNEFEQFEPQASEPSKRPGKGVQGLKEHLGIVKPEPVEENDHDPITGEIVEDEIDIFAEDVSENSPLDEIRFLIESATNAKDLLVAAKKGQDMSEDDRKLIREMFNKRSAELKNGVN